MRVAVIVSDGTSVYHSSGGTWEARNMKVVIREEYGCEVRCKFVDRMKEGES